MVRRMLLAGLMLSLLLTSCPAMGASDSAGQTMKQRLRLEEMELSRRLAEGSLSQDQVELIKEHMALEARAAYIYGQGEEPNVLAEHRFLVSQGLILVSTSDPLLADEVRPDPTGRQWNNADDDVGIESSPSAVTLSDSIYLSGGEYRFTGNWNWTGSPDQYADTLDFLACRMIYDNSGGDWVITDDYAYCYDAENDQTGYCHLSYSDPGSLVTKCDETAQGVIYNLEDLDDDIWTVYYQTDHGKGVIWVQPPDPITTQKFIFDFHHNYRTYEQDTSTVTEVSLSGFQYKLTVTYDQVNYQWQKASGGRLVSA